MSFLGELLPNYCHNSVWACLRRTGAQHIRQIHGSSQPLLLKETSVNVEGETSFRMTNSISDRTGIYSLLASSET